MMNQLPALPSMQPAMHPRRQHELSYAQPPPQLRPPYANYQGYNYPHHNGPPPQLQPQYANPNWYNYQQMQPSPQRQQHQSYSPLVVSSYPHYSPTPSSPFRHAPPSQAPHTVPQAALSTSPQVKSSRTSMPGPGLGLGPVPVPGPELAKSPKQPRQEAPATTVEEPAPKPVPEKVAEQASVLFEAPLPWFSRPDEYFPPRAARKRKLRSPAKSIANVKLPVREVSGQRAAAPSIESESPSNVPLPETETPVTSKTPSEVGSTQPTTPSPTVAKTATSNSLSAPLNKAAKSVVPVIPAVPRAGRGVTPRHSRQDSVSAASTSSRPVSAVQNGPADVESSSQRSSSVQENASTPTIVTAPPAPPKSWADLVRSKAQNKQVTPSTANVALQSGSGSGAGTGAGIGPGSFGTSKSDILCSIVSMLGSDGLLSDSKIAFLEPRGLVNTGNMCYMNSILQILLFCVPFFQFLDQTRKHAAHSFKSDTPLLDAMIMFMREFRVIDSATSVEQLKLRLKQGELEEFGDSFIPEYVYDVIKRLPRFSSMRRGHQQDAEEFLGFLLEGLHEECIGVMKAANANNSLADDSASSQSLTSPNGSAMSPSDAGWLEVGPKQKSSITRSSGIIDIESPITKIFGGKIRSELRVPGMKNSVTLEPYQPLQLDIGSPQVNNIIDALRNLTRPETLHGEFNSPRGPGIAATKQIFLETLPPVLIIHLKRFQYDNTGGTQKIWKKVDYPLELEIPKEVFSPHRRAAMTINNSLPKYKLIGVVYHHGKNASGGHYTVDVRRQEGREWIRLDDTMIRRVRSEEVATGGTEGDSKLLAAALEQHKNDKGISSGNKYEQVALDEEADSEAGWSQVNGSAGVSAGKKWTGVVNGASTPTSSSGKRSPHAKYSAKDSKVAYLLFYQKSRN